MVRGIPPSPSREGDYGMTGGPARVRDMEEDDMNGFNTTYFGGTCNVPLLYRDLRAQNGAIPAATALVVARALAAHHDGVADRDAAAYAHAVGRCGAHCATCATCA